MSQEKAIPPFKAGDPVSASQLEDLRQLVERGGVRGSGSIQSRTGSTGQLIRKDIPREFVAKITGNSGTAYAWTQQFPSAAGTWKAGFLHGTTTVNSAYEQNGSTTVSAGTFVWMRRATTGLVYLFDYGNC